MATELHLYRRVVGHFGELVTAVAPGQWEADTPDEGWTVADLVEHVVDRDRMLAATVGGAAPDELDAVGDPAISRPRGRNGWRGGSSASPTRPRPRAPGRPRSA